MINSKLTEILKTFSEQELKDFVKFTGIVYFNKGRNYIPLLKILRKFYPDFNNPALTRYYIYEKLFQGKKYNDQVIRNMLSGLLKICGQFIVINNIKSNSTDYNIILADELKNRMLFKHAESYINKSLKEIDETAVDKDYFRKRYELMQVKREITHGLNNTKGTIECLSAEAVDFFLFFLLETSRHVEEMVVFNHNLNANFENHLTFKLIENLNIENLSRYFTRSNLKNHKIAELFAVHINLLIDYTNEVLFDKFRSLLKESFGELSRWGKYNMYLCLENACIRLQEIDEIKYREILMDIYKEQLKEKLYNSSEQSPMAIDMFRNIVINSLRLKHFEWTEFFITEFIGTLSADHRENMYNFSFSLLNFEKRNFEKSLNYITKLKYDTFVFKYDVKVLSLMVYFELGYTEEAISMIDSFRHFINETPSISDYIREIHTNFIKFLFEIIRHRNGFKSRETQRLKSEITASRVRNKDWLLEKLETGH